MVYIWNFIYFTPPRFGQFFFVRNTHTLYVLKCYAIFPPHQYRKLHSSSKAKPGIVTGIKLWIPSIPKNHVAENGSGEENNCGRKPTSSCLEFHTCSTVALKRQNATALKYWRITLSRARITTVPKPQRARSRTWCFTNQGALRNGGGFAIREAWFRYCAVMRIGGGSPTGSSGGGHPINTGEYNQIRIQHRVGVTHTQCILTLTWWNNEITFF